MSDRSARAVLRLHVMLKNFSVQTFTCQRRVLVRLGTPRVAPSTGPHAANYPPAARAVIGLAARTRALARPNNPAQL